MRTEAAEPSALVLGLGARAAVALGRGLAAALTVVAGFVAVGEARLLGDAVERAGLDAFYTVPPDAVAGAPGTIVRSEELVGVPFDARAWRVMYRTTDVHGAAVVATGIVVPPALRRRGRTVLSWGHPTTGTARLRPSRGFDPYALIEGMRLLLDRGYTIAATDYVGMGTDGRRRLLPRRRDRRQRRARRRARGAAHRSRPRHRSRRAVGALAGRPGGAVRRGTRVAVRPELGSRASPSRLPPPT
jgi:hypothetical protein